MQTAHYRPLTTPCTLPVGTPVIYRCNGTGTPWVAYIAPRGPQGQFYVRIPELDLGQLGVCVDCELFS